VSVKKQRHTKVFSPTNLQDLLTYYRDHPGAVPFAGGTYLFLSKGPREGFGGELIDLGHVSELSQISRTERYMEIGTAVSISKILNTGRHVMPRSLFAALKAIGNAAVRNHATLGGNICARNHRLTAYPVLLLLDVRLELRRIGNTLWINLNRFIGGDDGPLLEPGELVTRIRIPFMDWDVEEFHQQERLFTPEHLIFCGVVRKQKDVISDLRTSFCIGNRLTIRTRNIEAELIGRKLPVPREDGLEMGRMLHQQIERNHPEMDKFNVHRIRRSLNWFLQILNDSE
jgi:CO/xanthine dehydrogenase FAD-binding subunit